jgi:hypothetical protein
MMRLLCFFLLLLVVTGCNVDDRVGNTKELSQEIKNSKIKRITNVQLTTTIDDWGKRIAVIAQKSMGEALKKNPEKATELCQNLQQLPLVAALEKEYGVQVQLLGTADLTNPAFTAKERELLDAYLYNAENKLPQSDNVQRLNDTLFVYNAPVPADHAVIQSCFAQQALPLAVWRVLFNKRDVIRKIDVKKLE